MQELQREPDAAHCVSLLFKLAEIYEIQLEDPPSAFNAFVRALPLDTGNELTLSSLERLAEQIERYRPQLVSVATPAARDALTRRLSLEKTAIMPASPAPNAISIA